MRALDGRTAGSSSRDAVVVVAVGEERNLQDSCSMPSLGRVEVMYV